MKLFLFLFCFVTLHCSLEFDENTYLIRDKKVESINLFKTYNAKSVVFKPKNNSTNINVKISKKVSDFEIFLTKDGQKIAIKEKIMIYYKKSEESVEYLLTENLQLYKISLKITFLKSFMKSEEILSGTIIATFQFPSDITRCFKIYKDKYLYFDCVGNNSKNYLVVVSENKSQISIINKYEFTLPKPIETINCTRKILILQNFLLIFCPYSFYFKNNITISHNTIEMYVIQAKQIVHINSISLEKTCKNIENIKIYPFPSSDSFKLNLRKSSFSKKILIIDSYRGLFAFEIYEHGIKNGISLFNLKQSKPTYKTTNYGKEDNYIFLSTMQNRIYVFEDFYLSLIPIEYLEIQKNSLFEIKKIFSIQNLFIVWLKNKSKSFFYVYKMYDSLAKTNLLLYDILDVQVSNLFQSPLKKSLIIQNPDNVRLFKFSTYRADITLKPNGANITNQKEIYEVEIYYFNETKSTTNVNFIIYDVNTNFSELAANLRKNLEIVEGLPTRLSEKNFFQGFLEVDDIETDAPEKIFIQKNELNRVKKKTSKNLDDFNTNYGSLSYSYFFVKVEEDSIMHTSNTFLLTYMIINHKTKVASMNFTECTLNYVQNFLLTNNFFCKLPVKVYKLRSFFVVKKIITYNYHILVNWNIDFEVLIGWSHGTNLKNEQEIRLYALKNNLIAEGKLIGILPCKFDCSNFKIINGEFNNQKSRNLKIYILYSQKNQILINSISQFKVIEQIKDTILDKISEGTKLDCAEDIVSSYYEKTSHKFSIKDFDVLNHRFCEREDCLTLIFFDEIDFQLKIVNYYDNSKENKLLLIEIVEMPYIGSLNNTGNDITILLNQEFLIIHSAKDNIIEEHTLYGDNFPEIAFYKVLPFPKDYIAVNHKITITKNFLYLVAQKPTKMHCILAYKLGKDYFLNFFDNIDLNSVLQIRYTALSLGLNPNRDILMAQSYNLQNNNDCGIMFYEIDKSPNLIFYHVNTKDFITKFNLKIQYKSINQQNQQDKIITTIPATLKSLKNFEITRPFVKNAYKTIEFHKKDFKNLNEKIYNLDSNFMLNVQKLFEIPASQNEYVKMQDILIKELNQNLLNEDGEYTYKSTFNKYNNLNYDRTENQLYYLYFNTIKIITKFRNITTIKMVTSFRGCSELISILFDERTSNEEFVVCQTEDGFLGLTPLQFFTTERGDSIWMKFPFHDYTQLITTKDKLIVFRSDLFENENKKFLHFYVMKYINNLPFKNPEYNLVESVTIQGNNFLFDFSSCAAIENVLVDVKNKTNTNSFNILIILDNSKIYLQYYNWDNGQINFLSFDEFDFRKFLYEHEAENITINDLRINNNIEDYFSSDSFNYLTLQENQTEFFISAILNSDYSHAYEIYFYLNYSKILAKKKAIFSYFIKNIFTTMPGCKSQHNLFFMSSDYFSRVCIISKEDREIIMLYKTNLPNSKEILNYTLNSKNKNNVIPIHTLTSSFPIQENQKINSIKLIKIRNTNIFDVKSQEPKIKLIVSFADRIIIYNIVNQPKLIISPKVIDLKENVKLELLGYNIYDSVKKCVEIKILEDTSIFWDKKFIFTLAISITFLIFVGLLFYKVFWPKNKYSEDIILEEDENDGSFDMKYSVFERNNSNNIPKKSVEVTYENKKRSYDNLNFDHKIN